MHGISRWLAGSIAVLAANGVNAHEFWIAPDLYRAEAGDETSAQLRVGKNMSGNAYPYLSRTVSEMFHWSGQAANPIDAREGSLPAIGGIELETPGLHRFSVVTNPAYVVFDTMTAFADYLEYEGLGPVAEMHRSRGLAETGIAEEYIRNARALVQVGPATADQRDAPTGMDYELTAIGNPYLPHQTELDVLLQWQGAAEAGTQVAVFRLPPGATAPEGTVRTLARTDEKGHARIAIDQPGAYLLNAVHIEPADGPGSVVWQSHWASLTFVVTGAD